MQSNLQQIGLNRKQFEPEIEKLMKKMRKLYLSDAGIRSTVIYQLTKYNEQAGKGGYLKPPQDAVELGLHVAYYNNYYARVPCI